MKLVTMQFRPTSSYCIHLKSRYSLHHTALERLHSIVSLNVKDQASDLHKTTGKLTISRLYSAILFLYGKLRDEIFQIENPWKQFLHLFYSYLILPTHLVTFVPSHLEVSISFFACSAIDTYVRVKNSTVTNGQMNSYTANHNDISDNILYCPQRATHFGFFIKPNDRFVKSRNMQYAVSNKHYCLKYTQTDGVSLIFLDILST